MRFWLCDLNSVVVKTAYSPKGRKISGRKGRPFIIDERSRPKTHKTMPLIEYAIRESVNFCHPRLYPSYEGPKKLMVQVEDGTEYEVFRTEWDSKRDTWRPWRLIFNKDLPDKELKKRILKVFYTIIKEGKCI